MSQLFLFVFLVLLVGCNRPDPAPELRDPVYLDIQEELNLAIKSLDEAKKRLSDHELALKSARPQTGEIRWARRKYERAVADVEYYEQQVKYWTLKLQSRKLHSRVSYNKAFRNNLPWPDEHEFKEYSSIRSLHRAKRISEKSRGTGSSQEENNETSRELTSEN
ncbi:MAG: hypothetical protein N2578_05195 [Bdellovibrionaceae bacterium]|nr:hypothetical protein [Pseudobdellovibrionaceae bacterium]